MRGFMRKVRLTAGLGVLETPMPRLILITPAIANGIREIVAEFDSTLTKPDICSGLVELDFERAAAGS